MSHTYYIVDSSRIDSSALVSNFYNFPAQRKSLIDAVKRTTSKTFTARTHAEAYSRLCGMLSVEHQRGILAVTDKRLVRVSLYDNEDFIIRI